MKRVIMGLAAGALLLTAGCSGEADGHAEPTGGSSAPTSPAGASSSAPESSTASDLPHSGAPEVTNPLPKTVLSGNPCDALAPEQIDAALGKAVAGEREDLSSGPGCQWSRPEKFTSIGVEFSLGTGEGLSAHYANTQPKSAIFREAAPVGGFPAVEFKNSEDSRSCAIAVGIADEYSVMVGTTQNEKGSDSCKGAARVAEDVVGNLKAKA
ncbi:Protein of unknown function (DUF3558) [Prauserella aidingensis]|uniref:DUF3558 domain-containing protein n=1 Tax=Prauserella aidingensis TaxID=387890 RepID=UPI0020A2B23C|nr:DUF3558 domain-containing protein [Prauserella aidingensis]MCP2256311.1 Protein of unknown function (DUF3558) [Prauserella aidingensis]